MPLGVHEESVILIYFLKKGSGSISSKYFRVAKDFLFDQLSNAVDMPRFSPTPDTADPHHTLVH